MRMIYTEGYQFPSGMTVVQRMGKRTRLRCKCGKEYTASNKAMYDKRWQMLCRQCSDKKRRRHDYEGIAADYRAGMTVPEIGRKYGLKNPDKLVYEVLKSLGVKRNRNPGPPRGRICVKT